MTETQLYSELLIESFFLNNSNSYANNTKSWRLHVRVGFSDVGAPGTSHDPPQCGGPQNKEKLVLFTDQKISENIQMIQTRFDETHNIAQEVNHEKYLYLSFLISFSSDLLCKKSLNFILWGPLKCGGPGHVPAVPAPKSGHSIMKKVILWKTS